MMCTTSATVKMTVCYW